jgi:hypothetical protein
MSNMRAFKLAAGQEETFSGGSFSYGGVGEAFNVGEALVGPDGELDPSKVIITDSALLANALAEYEPLEETAVPQDAAPMVLDKIDVEPQTTLPEEQDVQVGVAAVHSDAGDEIPSQGGVKLGSDVDE